MTIPTNLNLGIVSILVASIGGIIAAWNQVKIFLQRILDLFICRVAIKDELTLAVMSYMWTRGKRSPFGLKVFGGIKNYVHPNKRVELIGYESISSDPVLVWFNKKPALISRMQNNTYNDANIGSQSLNNFEGGPLRIYFLRGTFNLDDFLNRVIENYNEIHHKENLDKNNNTNKRFQIIKLKNELNNNNNNNNGLWDTPAIVTNILSLLKTNSARLIKWQKPDLMEDYGKSSFNDYPFPKHVTNIIEEIKLWKENGDFFKTKGIPWRRGYLLSGVPGTGKSTFIRSVGREFDLPLYIFDLANENNSTFPDNFQKVQASSPAIALIEDIDNVFVRRENVTRGLNPKDSLTFDCFLNTISGVGNSDGVLLFITTNNIEKLDPALGSEIDGKSTRPGRIDRIITLSTMQEPERRKLATLILDSWPEKIDNIVEATDGYTAAQCQEIFAQLALRLFWEKNRN